MKTTLLSKENNVVKFTMEFTAEEFDAAVVKAYQASKDQFVIDGFRKGKAPRSIIEKHYGEGIFFEDAINNMFQEAYPAAIKELDLEVIESPAADFSEIGHGKPLTVTITVGVFPIVEIKDYKGVEVEQVEAAVKAEDVDNEVKAMQKRNARVVTVEREVKDGDTVILDYAGFVGDDQFEGGTAENQELKIGSGMFIPGFEEQLVGAKAGEAVDVKVTFPEEYHAEDLAGKEAVFHCTVHEVKEEQLPELDDEFAKDVSEFDTLDELKKSIEEKLEKYAKDQTLNEAKNDAIEKVYQANEIDAPKNLVEDEIDSMAQELNRQLSYQGLGLQQYLQFMQKDMAEFRDELRADATKRVATRIILLSIADAENIEVTTEEMDAEIKEMASLYNVPEEQVRSMIGEDNMSFFGKDLMVKKAIDLIYDNANVKMVKEKTVVEPVAEEE
ncbi:MAG: trigger factor [Clostridia bacterium]|nr:trigger factor [Clostridia bacterium]MDO5302893.1 trigger factor [Clostridia bacterium]